MEILGVGLVVGIWYAILRGIGYAIGQGMRQALHRPPAPAPAYATPRLLWAGGDHGGAHARVSGAVDTREELLGFSTPLGTLQRQGGIPIVFGEKIDSRP
jgi:hypothetical protein